MVTVAAGVVGAPSAEDEPDADGAGADELPAAEGLVAPGRDPSAPAQPQSTAAASTSTTGQRGECDMLGKVGARHAPKKAKRRECLPSIGAVSTRSRLILRLTLGAVTVLLVAGGVMALAWWPRPVAATVSGLPDRTVLGTADLDGLRITISPTGNVPRGALRVLLDGRRADLVPAGAGLALEPGPLADGRHELVVRVSGRGPLGRTSSSRHEFTVDTTPPKLTLPDRLDAASLRGELAVKGTVTGADRVTVNDVTAELEQDTFRATLAAPPATVQVVATDAAGNSSRAEVPVHVKHPAMRGVHMTALAWTASSLREPILRLAKQGRIDTIELDIKDEDGIVGHDSQVPMARRTGAAKGYYDARAVIDQLHKMQVRVVGRIVAFRDPKLGRWAWRHGHRDWVIQTPGGAAYGGKYGAYSFTNPFSAEVRRYNVALATEAAELGFDDVLYDYVRRPDGDLRNLRFPGRSGSPEAVIAQFMQETRAEVRQRGAFLGASVYGISATRPTQIAQDIPMMAKSADYIAPMVYPSHWGPGEYGVANPNRSPYPIVRRSLADFQRLVRDSDTQIMPWLQDFSLGVTYGPARVRAQIRAAHDAGSDSFLLWNAAARYTAAALTPHP